MTLTGTLREAMMFGENLRLKRRLSTALGDDAIYLEDCVTNLGHVPEYIQILYHCNFGYPFLMPGSEIAVDEHEIAPRDEVAAAGLAERARAPGSPGRNCRSSTHRNGWRT